MQFLGIDLAWRPDNPSGVALLAGTRLPLRLREVGTVRGHGAALAWIGGHTRRETSAVAIDAPLLGTERPGRRGCDDAISRAFGAYHASTHTPPRLPHLRDFARALVVEYGRDSFDPGRRPGPGRPAIREVYPNALQVFLFNLAPGATIVKYKKRRFGTKRRWAEEGLAPFVARCSRTIGDRYVSTADAGWGVLVGDRPAAGMSTAELKAIEDRWDALLCALAAVLEWLVPGAVRAYADGDWRRGYILAPASPGTGSRT